MSTNDASGPTVQTSVPSLGSNTTTGETPATAGGFSDTTQFAQAPAMPATPPSGTLPTVAPCCPDVAKFEGSTAGRSSYFGFDDKTNLVANVGVDEYWIPPASAKSAPTNRETRDGARWVSVGVGRETQVTIEFDGTFTTNCLPNCTYEVGPPGIAAVLTTTVTASGVAFRLRGARAGEATLKVVCDGLVRGYFHIWCAQRVTLNLDVVEIITRNTRPSNHSVANVGSVVNRIFSQALIRWSVRDLGTVDLSDGLWLRAHEWLNISRDSNNNNEIQTTPALANRLHSSAEDELADRQSEVANGSITGTGPQARLPRQGAYRLYYYIPDYPGGGTAGGRVITIGQSPAFVFFDNAGSSDNSAAHELGHSLGLEHPVHNTNRDQFAAHNLNTLGQAVAALPATNTEPAVSTASARSNIMASDPLNLMGYWRTKAVREPIRYHQWKTCKRT